MFSRLMLNRELTGRLDRSLFFPEAVRHAVNTRKKLVEDIDTTARVYLWSGGVYVHKRNVEGALMLFNRELHLEWVYPVSYHSFLLCSEEGVLIAQNHHASPAYTDFTYMGHDGVVALSKRVEDLCVREGFLKGAADRLFYFASTDEQGQHFISSLDLKTLFITHVESVGPSLHVTHSSRDEYFIFSDRLKEKSRAVLCDGMITRIGSVESLFGCAYKDFPRRRGNHHELFIRVNTRGWYSRHLISGCETGGPIVGPQGMGELLVISHQAQNGLIFSCKRRKYFISIEQEGAVPYELRMEGWPHAAVESIVYTNDESDRSFQIWDCTPCFHGGQPIALTSPIEGCVVEFNAQFLAYCDYTRAATRLMFVDFRI